MFKKGKINTITTIILLVITYLLNLVDYAQTVLCVQTFGPGVELNPLIRFCFEHDCALAVKLIIPLILVLLIGFITIKIEPRYICVAICVLILYTLVVWHNFFQLAQVGLINLDYWRETLFTYTAATRKLTLHLL